MLAASSRAGMLGGSIDSCRNGCLLRGTRFRFVLGLALVAMLLRLSLVLAEPVVEGGESFRQLALDGLVPLVGPDRRAGRLQPEVPGRAVQDAAGGPQSYLHVLRFRHDGTLIGPIPTPLTLPAFAP